MHLFFIFSPGLRQSGKRISIQKNSAVHSLEKFVFLCDLRSLPLNQQLVHHPPSVLPMEPPFKKPRVFSPSALDGTDKIEDNNVGHELTPTSEEIYETDLPLLANVKAVHVSHYLFYFDVSIDTQTVSGTEVIFVERVNKEENVTEIILDCCTVEVSKVETIRAKISENVDETWISLCADDFVFEEIKFELDKWSLRIYGWTGDFPEAVRIHYRTLPSSPSLHWRPVKGYRFDPDVPLCCFTPGDPVNNRGLFPCQEPPTAMATWQCFVQVQRPYTAFLSSDKPALSHRTSTLMKTVSYFNCSEALPMSTFAIFVTRINAKNEIESPKNPRGSSSLATAERLVYQDRAWAKAAANLQNFILKLIEESGKVLGKLPFDRVDFILMPRTFPTIGLANPNMIFLSPSLLAGQTPLMYSRTAHELAHFWFGLSIGALDWTEEWLSEGFATFMEDIFLSRTLPRCTDLTSTEDINLRPCIRLLTLQHELENSTNPDFHRLVQDESAKEGNSIKNGRDPMKQVLQVHYLKGYFFLKVLSNLVTEERFLQFLLQYVHSFKGTLVTSQDFVAFFKSKFCPEFDPLKIDLIADQWLRQVPLPEPYCTADLSKPTMILTPAIQELFPNCVESLSKINNLTLSFLSTSNDSFPLNSTEKQIFIEQILNVDDLTEQQLDLLEGIIQPQLENPEVIHRWCEVIIKFQSLSKIHTVRRFLLFHPAMGIYLYGELMISERRKFQKLAKNLYEKRKNIIDPPLLQILKTMIF